MEQVKQYVVADGLIDLGVKGGTFVRLEDYAALQQKLDAVLAENLALRNAHPQPFGREMMKAIDAYIAKEDDVPEQGMMDAFFILRDSITLKSPQVDSILNEVRANGVEMYAQSLRRKQEDAFTESEYRHTKLGRAAVSAEKFAAQLRSGSTEGGDE